MNNDLKKKIKITREEFRKKAMDVATREGKDAKGIPQSDKEDFVIAKTLMGMMFAFEIEQALFNDEEEE